MIYAKNGLIALKHWYHDSNLKNNEEYTVAIILAHKGIIPPK